jgi:hypothetical protein
MGTRADYYIRRRNGTLEYQGSTAWDGYPTDNNLIPLIRAYDITTYVHVLGDMSSNRDDWSDEWPWPWANSTTTDYQYVWDVTTSSVFIYNWGDLVTGGVTSINITEWPDMNTDTQAMVGSTRSGILVF